MKVIFFDADGTLLTFSKSIGAQYAALFLEFEIERSAVEVEQAVWTVWQEKQDLYLNKAQNYRTSAEQEYRFWEVFFDSVCTRLVCANPEGLFDKVYAHFATLQARPLKQGAVELFRTLHSHGIIMAVLSNHDSRLRRVLSQSALAPLLEVVLTSDVTGYKKPAIQAFQHAADTVGVSGSEIVHIGNDLSCDYKGALAAGWQALLLDEKGEFKADTSIRSVPSLAAVAKELKIS